MSCNHNDFDEYFKLYEEARELERINKVNAALEIYLSILKKYEPCGIAYYERPAIILEKQKNYIKALEVCDIALNNPNRFNEPTWEGISEKFTKRKNRLVSKINKGNSSSNDITTNSSKSSKKKSSSLAISSTNGNSITKEIVYPDWYISISFGKSKSDNFVQALAIAKMAPQFIENNIEGKILYQAIYSDSPSEYLQFIKLYELVSQWKSCFVIINGNLMDRKIIGKLNYCYGDKCRSGNKDFCYGASEMTINPFGCHRLQISSSNNPWWTFSTKTNKGYIIDKKAIHDRIIEKSSPYSSCPNFDINKILSILSSLPNTLSFGEYEKLERDNSYCGEIVIKLDDYKYSLTEDEKESINETKKESPSFLKKIFKIFTK